MAIQSADIQLRASQVMDDVPEGGGGPTARVIRDGVSNDVFQDISEVARTGGRTYMRKLFLSVATDDTDRYLDANIILSDIPADPRVSVTLYSTKDVFDRRDSAKARAEAYLGSGSEWGGYLLENHIRDQRSIQIFQYPGSTIPTVGHTLRLVWREGKADEREQFVRMRGVTSAERTFVDPQGKPYKALVVTCDLSDALRHDFPGSPPTYLFTRLRNGDDSVLRDTVVANALTFYGASKLAETALFQGLSAKVKSVFSQIVPSAQTEIPLQLTAASRAYAPVQSDNGTVSYTTGAVFNSATVLSLGNAVYPGSLVITTTGGQLIDQGGRLMAGTTEIGTVEYALGDVRFADSAPAYSGTKTVTFHPAGAPLQLADTAGIAVTQESRGYNWQITLDTPPAPGTAFASYRSGDKWYDLKDNGAGVLKGADSSFGSGTVSYTTNTISISCGALPDAGSEVVFGWGSRVNYMNRAGTAGELPRIYLKLAHPGVAPGSLEITWNDDTLITISDDGHGHLVGNGVTNTRVNYTTGEAWFTPSVLPAVSTQYQCAYSFGPPEAESFTAPLRNPDGTVTITLGKTDITPGTVEVTWNVNIEEYNAISTTPAEMQIRPTIDPYKTVRDDGSGVLKDALGTTFGTVNYAAGTFTFRPDVTVSIPWPRYTVTPIGWVVREQVYRNVFKGFDYKPAAASMPIDLSALVSVKYRAADSAATVTDAVSALGITLDLTQFFSEAIVPGSVNFRLGGKTYFDRVGVLYYDLDILTGSAIQAGTLNYQSGEAVLNAWASGEAPDYALKSLLTSLDGRPVDEVTFRTSVSPIKPGSFQLMATQLQGGQINVTADLNGNISGTNVIGTFGYESGVARVRFGAWVTAAGHEAEIWYSADAVREDGKIFRPTPVFADTIRHNAVAYSWLPLDADIIGMDPVRLPQDGRVEIFRQGGYVVFGHTGTIGPAAVSNGQVINCGRERLARAYVVGSDGVTIHTGYSADLDAGRITFNNVSGYAQPVRILHRIEEMKYLSDVQINGQLAFTSPLTREFPIGSVVSSALMAGDLRARVPLLFDQATWLNNWSDTPEGNSANATYNDTAFPILVTNRGALTERWVIVFTNTTTFNVIGEHVGQIITGASTAVDCSPLNPSAGAPYWTLFALGLGQGWVPGNVIRFNTVGTPYPFWALLTVQPGQETVIDDAFGLLGRGGVDRP